MRTVLQRVGQASVSIDGKLKSSIGRGMLILLGVQPTDTAADIEYLCQKIVKLRIFDDAHYVPNLSLLDIGGELLVVSQFTLMASTHKGNRPSYIHAARPEVAIPLYEQFVRRLEELTGRPVATGQFGADMQVSLVNDGPFTILLDSPAA